MVGGKADSGQESRLPAIRTILGGEFHGRLAPWPLFLPGRKLNDRRRSQ